MLKLDGKNRIVPTSFLSQLVVGQNVGSDLIVGQIVQAYGRNLLDRQEFRGLDATMAGDNHPRAIDQNGIGEAELAHAVCDLTNLALGMGSRVSRVGDQILNCLVRNLQLT